MKIVFTSKEHQAISAVKNMFGLSTTAVSKAIVSVTKNDTETIVETHPDFVVDYCGLVTTIAPILKGLYQQAIGVFSVVNTLGENLDKKWSEPIQRGVEI